MLAVVIALGAAGCGSGTRSAAGTKAASAAELHVSFTTPASWRVDHGVRRLAATDGQGLVWVQVYPLAQSYRPSLFAEAVPQLDARVRQIALQENARVTSSRTVTLAGRRGRAYTLDRSGLPSEKIGFVLIDQREYELYCRLAGPDAARACDQLFSSFRAGP